MDKSPYLHTENVHNTQSANEVLPFILEMFTPKSILDVGCGIGTWLTVAHKLGVEDICGLDTPFVNKDQMHIAEKHFIPTDLSKTFDIGRKFDLAICLEVAEHLPESSAAGFISSIVHHADIVLFSAAIPGQGGQNHVNEQWLDYWTQLYKQNGFDAYDFLRKKWWDNPNIEWWYRQNMVIFAKRAHPLFANMICEEKVMSLIHPIPFTSLVDRNKYLESPGVKASLGTLNKAIRKKL